MTTASDEPDFQTMYVFSANGIETTVCSCIWWLASGGFERLTHPMAAHGHCYNSTRRRESNRRRAPPTSDMTKAICNRRFDAGPDGTEAACPWFCLRAA